MEDTMSVYPLTEPLPCLLCEREFQPVDTSGPLRASGQPYKGVMCWTPGSYGSQVFDTMGDTRLYFNICDPCLLLHRDKMILMRIRHHADTIEHVPGHPFEGVVSADLAG